MNITPEFITELEPRQVFVFGSNEAGVHGAGAALIAFKKFGARAGQGFGPQGQSFGVPTKDWRIRRLPLPNIQFYVFRFLKAASVFKNREFLVTKIGCGLAGYTPDAIAALFFTYPRKLPDNVWLPKEFWDFINKNPPLPNEPPH